MERITDFPDGAGFKLRFLPSLSSCALVKVLVRVQVGRRPLRGHGIRALLSEFDLIQCG